jgi:hypothetical protein
MLSAAIFACLAVVGVFAQSEPELVLPGQGDLPDNLENCKSLTNPELAQCTKVDIAFELIGKPSLDIAGLVFELVEEDDVENENPVVIYQVSNYIDTFFQCKAQYLLFF